MRSVQPSTLSLQHPQKERGKLHLSHRYDRLPLLPSGPGGVGGSWSQVTCPGAKVGARCVPRAGVYLRGPFPTTVMATKPATEQKDLDIGQVYTRTELFLENNKKAVTIGVVGVLVIVGAALGWKSWVNSK